MQEPSESAGTSTSGLSSSILRAKVCFLCGESSSSPNPCTGPLVHKSFALWTGRPWYRKDAQGTPEGKLCKLCPLAWSIAAFEGYADISDWHKAAQKDIGMMNALASCVEKLIDLIIKGNTRFCPRGKGSQSIILVKTETLKAFETRQVRFKGPEIQYVTVDAYIDEKGHHPSKDGHKVIYEELDGKVQPCIAYRLGKKGHFTMVPEHIRGFKKEEHIDDGSATLREGQIDSKFKANARQLDVAEDDLSDLTAILDSLTVAGHDGSASSSGMQQKVGNTNVGTAGGEEEEEQEDDSNEGVNAAAIQMSSMFKRRSAPATNTHATNKAIKQKGTGTGTSPCSKAVRPKAQSPSVGKHGSPKKSFVAPAPSRMQRPPLTSFAAATSRVGLAH